MAESSTYTPKAPQGLPAAVLQREQDTRPNETIAQGRDYNILLLEILRILSFLGLDPNWVLGQTPPVFQGGGGARRILLGDDNSGNATAGNGGNNQNPEAPNMLVIPNNSLGHGIGIQGLSATINGLLSGGESTITVDDTAGFPAAGWLILADGTAEQVEYTALNDTTFTLNGTVAGAHADNSLVFLSDGNAGAGAGNGNVILGGLVLRSPDGSYYKVTVGNGGVLATAVLASPLTLPSD